MQTRDSGDPTQRGTAEMEEVVELRTYFEMEPIGFLD